MPTETEYVEMISSLDHAGLLTLWDQVEQRDTPGWPPGKAFEYLVLRAFQLEGAEVSWPYSVNLFDEEVEQLDGAIFIAEPDLPVIVESKDWLTAINIETIAKLRNQLMRRPASALGAVFSYNGFTEPARLLAQYLAPQTILLWSGKEVALALHTQAFVAGMKSKYRAAVEHGLADFNIAEETVE